MSHQKLYSDLLWLRPLYIQPIISDHYISLNGFLVKKINNTIHYLLQKTFEPGFVFPKYTSTISIKNYDSKKNNSRVKFFNFFQKKKKTINFINSDEGGRFFQNETHNSICILKSKDKLSPKENFIWVSHNQVVDLINKNLLSIEARNLFASFNIDKIK